MSRNTNEISSSTEWPVENKRTGNPDNRNESPVSQEEQSEFKFVLTNEKGEPIEFRFSDSEEEAVEKVEETTEKPEETVIETADKPVAKVEDKAVQEKDTVETPCKHSHNISKTIDLIQNAKANEIIPKLGLSNDNSWEVKEDTLTGDEFSKFLEIESLINKQNLKIPTEENSNRKSVNLENKKIIEKLCETTVRTPVDFKAIPKETPKETAKEIAKEINWDFEFESEEEENLDEFIKFMQIEKLILKFPENNLKEKIEDLLSRTERSEIEMKFLSLKKTGFERNVDSNISKINALKNKTSSSIETIRIEFNRVTESNLNSVIENIKKIHVEKVSEMKLISAFVYEKIISEPVYSDLYVYIVGQLKECSWKCEEEKSMSEKSQTCFFGTLMGFAKHKMEAEQDWYTEVDVSSLDHSSRGELEKQIEEKISEKIKKKEHSLGNVYFLISLYLKNITGLPNVQQVIDKLLSRNTPENIVMVCYIYRPLVEKLMNMNRTDVASRIVKYLKDNENTPEIRLQIEIEKALKYNPLTTVKKTTMNPFAGMLSVEEEPKKTDNEVLQSYIKDILTAVVDLGDEEELLEYGDKVYKAIDRFDNKAFFLSYLIELVSNHKYNGRLLEILMKKLLPKALDLNLILQDLKEEMHMLSIDVVCSNRYYAELLCMLRSKNKINKEEFESFKMPQFLKNSSGLLKKWKQENDTRLKVVATEEEILTLN